MENCNACGAPLTPEGDCPGQVEAAKVSKGGLVPVEALAEELKGRVLTKGTLMARLTWLAQAQRTHDLTKFRKLVEDVKASHKALKPDIIFGIELACDDILKAIKEGK